jgi:hypothetical protein
LKKAVVVGVGNEVLIMATRLVVYAGQRAGTENERTINQIEANDLNKAYVTFATTRLSKATSCAIFITKRMFKMPEVKMLLRLGKD